MSHKFPESRVCKGLPLRAELWRNDVTVTYSAGDEELKGGGERSEITMLSRESLRRLAFVAHNTAVRFDSMVTLTYPAEFCSDGQEVKRHLRTWLKWSRREGGVNSYLWALEFQRRQAPHFHIFTAGGDLLHMKQAVSLRWFEIVASDDPKHLAAGTRTERLRKPDAAGRYAAKYASKPHQKAVPPNYRNVGRFWGHSYDVKPEPLASKPLTGWGDLITEFEGWEHQERLKKRKPISILYNAGIFLQEQFQDDNLSLQERQSSE